MGLRFRKSIKAGPLRINLSKSGVGYSIGTKHLRYTKKANGGVRKTATIPGTGISYVTETSGKKKPRSSTPITQPETTEPVEKKKLPAGFWKGTALWYLLVGVFGALAKGLLNLPDPAVVLTGIAGASISTYLIGKRRKAKKQNRPLIVPPDQLDNPDYYKQFEEDDNGNSPRPGCILPVVGVLILSLIGSCAGGNTTETTPTEPSTPAIIATAAPTERPTDPIPETTTPTEPETEAPTAAPTEAPVAPTAPPQTQPKPTEAPTVPPTEPVPTAAPTTPPTEPEPTERPTEAPTAPPATEAPVPETTERDVRTYILNSNTGKFHYPSCSSVKTIKPEHYIQFTGTREEVLAKKYEPCGRCHP